MMDMERKTPFEVGVYYHVYNRGIDKQLIFKQKNDYSHFQRLLYSRNSTKRIDSTRVKGLPFHKIDRDEQIVDVIAYVLMPNHFHLLLHENRKDGISSFMSKLGTAHAMYMNKKYTRTGSLMCHPFRSVYVDSDEYMRWLLSYIHLNPSELNNLNTTKDLLLYPYSSYPDYYGVVREEKLILEMDQLPFDVSELEDMSTMLKIMDEEVFQGNIVI